jgi:hypothetical protein
MQSVIVIRVVDSLSYGHPNLRFASTFLKPKNMDVDEAVRLARIWVSDEIDKRGLTKVIQEVEVYPLREMVFGEWKTTP